MAKQKESGITWCDYTFNHIRGCTKVSEGCAHCYADELSKRNPATLGVWGDNGTRVLASDDYWKQPFAWNKLCRHDMVTVNNIDVGKRRGVKTTRQTFLNGASKDVESSLNRCVEEGFVIEQDGLLQIGRAFERPRVFCASLADIFEDWQGPILDHRGKQVFVEGPDGPGRPKTMDDIRRNLFELIDATPNLDYLLLTKRPENIRKMWVDEKIPWRATGQWHRDNVWLGATVENQEQAGKRIPELLKCRDLSPVLFLSCEPLLGPVDLNQAWRIHRPDGYSLNTNQYLARCRTAGIDWAIVGAESGAGRRPMQTEWAGSLKDQCKAAGVAFFMKQMEINGKICKDVSEFPEHLRIQEFPRIS